MVSPFYTLFSPFFVSSFSYPLYFSVVYHPRNDSLRPSIDEFQKLIGYSDRFFAFSSEKLINRAKEINEPALSEWVRWYQELYYF